MNPRRAQLTNQTTFTDPVLIGKADVEAEISGQDLETSGLFQGFDRTTGTISFTTPLSGLLKYKYYLTLTFFLMCFVSHAQQPCQQPCKIQLDMGSEFSKEYYS